MEKIKVIKVLNEEHGKEVIKYLESIGGENGANYIGDSVNEYYGINKQGFIIHISECNNNFEIIELPKKHPERGTEVLVWDSCKDYVEKRIFIDYIEGAINPVVVVNKLCENDFLEGKFFSVNNCDNYELILEPKIIELTLKEIAEKFNIPIEQLRIKE